MKAELFAIQLHKVIYFPGEIVKVCDRVICSGLFLNSFF